MIKIEKIILPVNRPFNKKVFLFLLLLLIPAAFAIIPFTLTLTSVTVYPGQFPLLLFQIALNILIAGVLAAIGLFLAGKIGLGLPFIEGWANKNPIWEKFKGVLILSVILGIIFAVAVIFLDLVVFGPLLQTEFQSLNVAVPETARPPPWQGFLASFSAGVTEEVELRLFLMSLFAWVGGFILKDREGRPAALVLWGAVILAAILFGLGHLPLAIQMGIPLTPLFVIRTVVLNGMGGIVFGWLYWTRGLESAMVAHFSGDIVLHVILVLVLQLL